MTPKLPFLALTVFATLCSMTPVRGGSPLQIADWSLTPAGTRLGWTSQGAGVAYTVQYRDTLGAGIWLSAPASEPWPILPNSWVDGFIETNQVRFYRVLAVPAAQRGRLIAGTFSRTVTMTELAYLFRYLGIPTSPQYEARMYKIAYETISPWGAQTTASGALVLPIGAGKSLRLVSYQHGTIIETNKAPSSMDLGTELAVGVAFAATGYAAVLPDYLGLGASPGFHPYQHARSEATAGVDLLRAARTFAGANGAALTNQLFLCGYSQGGHATMALLRELEMFHTNEFKVTACAPMAGAYDMSGVTASDFLSGRAQPNPYYFAYLLAAYQDVYRLAPTLADLLAPPYDATLPPLLKGNTSGTNINKAMPSDPVLILKPELLAAFRADPHHPLRAALRDNDVYWWKPNAPMRMYHCSSDQDVIYANSQVALASFESLGATQVQLVNPSSSLGHGDCAQPSLVLAKAWFDSIK